MLHNDTRSCHWMLDNYPLRPLPNPEPNAVYVKDYATGADCHQGLKNYFHYYCRQRPHTSLGLKTPWEAYSLSPPNPLLKTI